MVGQLTDGLIEHVTLLNVHRVRSQDQAGVYFVSAELEGPGLEGGDDVATWATDSLAVDGSVYSVNALAIEQSNWPQRYSMTDDGAEESADCARG